MLQVHNFYLFLSLNYETVYETSLLCHKKYLTVVAISERLSPRLLPRWFGLTLQNFLLLTLATALLPEGP